MSSIALSGNASGAGVFTIASPNSASSYTITLPTVTGGSFIVSDASGNVGIGTSSPSQKLQVTGNTISSNFYIGTGTASAGTFGADSAGTGASIIMYGSTGANPGAMLLSAGSAERMRIDSSGNVGIGTTAPNKKLEVSDATDTQIRFTGTSTANGAQLVGYSNSDAVSFGVGGSTGGRFGATLAYIGSLTNVPMLFMTNSIERMRIDTSGFVFVGCTATPSSSVSGVRIGNPSSGATISSCGATTTSVTHNIFTNGNGQVGSISTNGSATAFTTSSDYRLKEDIAPMTGALAKVSALKPVTYKWKVDGDNGEGFIAHELADVCPHAVIGEKDAVDADGNPVYQGIDVSFLVATLTAAIQEQQALITSLTARVAALEGAAV